MGLSTEKFTTKSSDHPKIGFWDLASGDAKSPEIIFVKSRREFYWIDYFTNREEIHERIKEQVEEDFC